MTDDKMAKNLNADELENVSGGISIQELTKGCIVHAKSAAQGNEKPKLTPVVGPAEFNVTDVDNENAIPGFKPE